MQPLEDLIAQLRPASVGIAAYDLAAGREILHNADEHFPPASTFKVAVMAEVFRQAEAGLLSLDDRIPITNSFRSAADGEPYSVQSEDDADPSLYIEIGNAESVRELVRRMIVRSSNLATNVLIEKIGVERINALLQDSGIAGISVIRGVFDRRAHALGMDNRTTAGGLTGLMRQMAEGRLVSKQASREMIAIMLGQEFNEGIPAGLPATVRVAHKTGWDDEIYHDTGIIFPEDRGPYALTVLTRGIRDEAEARAGVAGISRLVYAAMQQ